LTYTVIVGIVGYTIKGRNMPKTKKRNPKTSIDYLEIACELAGGPSKLGLMIGCTRQFMNGMLRGVSPIPIRRAIMIERALEHKVTAQQLRPDLADIL
jgi:hypothetical protein